MKQIIILMLLISFCVLYAGDVFGAYPQVEYRIVQTSINTPTNSFESKLIEDFKEMFYKLASKSEIIELLKPSDVSKRTHKLDFTVDSETSEIVHLKVDVIRQPVLIRYTVASVSLEFHQNTPRDQNYYSVIRYKANELLDQLKK